MTQHLGARRAAVECDECNGRSFTDPMKEFHYPECSKYARWRFGPRPKTVVSVSPIRKPRLEIPICPHRPDGDWTACITCSDAADFDGGGEW